MVCVPAPAKLSVAGEVLVPLLNSQTYVMLPARLADTCALKLKVAGQDEAEFGATLAVRPVMLKGPTLAVGCGIGVLVGVGVLVGNVGLGKGVGRPAMMPGTWPVMPAMASPSAGRLSASTMQTASTSSASAAHGT